MIQIHGRIVGDESIVRELRGIVSRARDPRPVLAAIGHRVAFTHVQQRLSRNEMGAPAPSGFPRAYRAGGQPLLDTRRLASSIAYRVVGLRDVEIGTAVRYGGLLRQGPPIVIRPTKGKFLNFPLNPPLSQTEVRGFPKGKSAIRARYPGSFGLVRGPEGPGIYRTIGRTTKGRRRGVIAHKRLSGGASRYAAGRGVGIERIVAWVKSAKQRRYGVLAWQRAWGGDLIPMGLQIVATGRGARMGMAGGTPDRGPRGGQLE